MTLSSRHRGEVAHIVGRGPSLLDLTLGSFGAGPLLVLNHALLRIRALNPLNQVYSFQKDGCLVEPKAPETLILSKAQSRTCFDGYQPRVVIDVRALGLPVHCMSVTFAVAMAIAMGCTGARLFAFDSYTRGDFRTVQGDELVTIGRGYLHAAEQVKRYAARRRFPLEWVA